MMTQNQLLDRLISMNINYAKRNVIQRRTIIRYSNRAIAYLYPPEGMFDHWSMFNQKTLAHQLKNLRYTTKGE